MQSAAICLSLRGSLFGNLDPCDASIITRAGFFPSRVGRLGGLGGIHSHWCSILVVHRLYYRIIRFGLFLLGFCLCLRCLAFLLFSFLLLRLLYEKERLALDIVTRSFVRCTSFSSSRSFASRSFMSFSHSSHLEITRATAPSAAASGFLAGLQSGHMYQQLARSRHAPQKTHAVK